MTLKEFFGKTLYNMSSRSFIGFAFVSVLYAYCVIKILALTGETAVSFRFLFDAMTTLEGFSFAAFLGKASLKSWLEFKNGKTE